nr:hypothetical protein [Tanacetum cinerariifolium]
PDYPDKVYKVVKALYGLHQAPKAWYETLANYILENGFQRGKIDQTLFIKKQRGLQVKQKQDGIFISQDKYVAEILRKFGLTHGKSARTPIDTDKPLLKDPDGDDVDTIVATSSSEAKYIAAVSCCAQVLWIQNQLLDYGQIFNAVSSQLLLFGLTIDAAYLLLLVAGETCATLTKQVANLEQDKVAQEIEITKMKQRVRRRIHPNRGEITDLYANEYVTLEEVDDEVPKDADVQGRLEEYQAKVYHLDLEHADKVLSMQETDEAQPAEVEEVIEVVTAAKLMTEVVTTAATTITDALVLQASAPRRRRGVIIQDPEEAATASVIVQSEVKRKERQDNTVMRYQALKSKPVTEAHARKNLMVYLKNMAGFKMDFFRGMTYIEIRPIFEKHYNSIQAFLEKGEKEIKEEGSKRKMKVLSREQQRSKGLMKR